MGRLCILLMLSTLCPVPQLCEAYCPVPMLHSVSQLPWLELVLFLVARFVSKSIICAFWLQQCLSKVWSLLQVMWPWLEGLSTEPISLALLGSGGSSWMMCHAAVCEIRV